MDSKIKHEQPHDEPPVIGSICENTNGVLELFVTTNHTPKIFGGGIGVSGNADLDYTEVMDKLKGYTLYVECDKGIFRITCNKLTGIDESGAFLSIESLATQDGKTVSGEPVEMKKMLGLDGNKKFIKITEISKNPITVSKSETTDPEAEQHTVGNDLSVNA